MFNDGLRTMANFFTGRPIGGATTAPSLAGGYPHMPMGYDQHWSFGVQRELPFNSVLEVNYVGNRGVNLYEGNPINDPPAGAGAIQAAVPIRYSAASLTTARITPPSITRCRRSSRSVFRPACGSWFLTRGRRASAWQTRPRWAAITLTSAR